MRHLGKVDPGLSGLCEPESQGLRLEAARMVIIEPRPSLDGPVKGSPALLEERWLRVGQRYLGPRHPHHRQGRGGAGR